MIRQPLTSTWGRAAALLTLPLLALGTLTTIADEKGKPAAGEGKASAEREGGARKSGERDGDKPKTGARDGETKKNSARDGEGEGKKTGPRDGDKPKSGAREGDGDKPKSGAREGEGEGKKTGPRDGEKPKSGASEGEGKQSAEGGKRMTEGEGADKAAAPASAGQQLIILVNAKGEVTNSAGQVIPMNQVRGRMNELAKSNPDQDVVLRSDPDAPMGKVNAVLDALHDVGWKQVKTEVTAK